MYSMSPVLPTRGVFWTNTGPRVIFGFVSREVELDVEELHPFLKGQVSQYIVKQRGLKADDVAREMHVSRAKMYEVLRGKGTEDQILVLDRAITALSDKQGGPLKITGAGPDVVEGFQEVLRDGWLESNGYGMESLQGRIRRGTR